MHLLQTSSTTLDDLVEPIDLGQTPGDIAVLSFADSDLSGLAAAFALDKDSLPSVRLAHLRDLRHPMSIDLWLDRVGVHAKIIVVRLLGGLDWWRYGVDMLSEAARARGIALAVLPGEDRDDTRLDAASTLPPEELRVVLGFFREGGRENMRALLRRLASYAGQAVCVAEPESLPRVGGYLPEIGAVPFDTLLAQLAPGLPVVPIIFYRAALLAADTAPIDALYKALGERGLAPAPLVIPSLKDHAARKFLQASLPRLAPAVILTTTAFAAASESEASPLDVTDAPVHQVIIANTKRAAWAESPRGLGSSDLAMHVVLPEIDGRVLAGAISFKDPVAADAALAFTGLMNRPEPDRVGMVTDRVAALARLRALPRAKRRVAVLMPDYPGAAGRTGYAVGLDVPASVLALLADLTDAGYAVGALPETPRALIDMLEAGAADAMLSLADYQRLAAELPASVLARIIDAWGAPAHDEDVSNGAFRFRARFFGNVLVALPPERGRKTERRADYHDPSLPPRHALLAFGLWLRHTAKTHAIVHLGAHGTLEWLPGKSVALTNSCFPEAVLGTVPVIYPFIVTNPGEAAQAKRRIAGITIGHLPPPLVNTDLSGPAQALERLVDEYAIADGLDGHRRERLARLIVESAQSSGLAREAGLAAESCPDAALKKIDAWLCDLKDLALKDGLHIYGRADAGQGNDPQWQASAEAEGHALLDALDGKRIPAGPAGAPSRGRRDVLPTGRNLFTADPRVLPTPTAMDLGRIAADEVVRNHLQSHGEMPRSLVIDLWGSATLRTGGEEIAQGLALMGCRPTWDTATGRVTGIEVLPPAAMGRPRIDVTFRISGLFRDLFPAQIALLDAAVQLVAQRSEDDHDNPLAATHRQKSNGCIHRIFGNAPGAYGAGVEDLLGQDAAADDIGAAYLAAASHAYCGAEGVGDALPDAFAERVAAADLLLHPSDDPGRDLLDGSEDAAFVGGFAAAAKSLGRTPDLVMLDLTDPKRPRARALDQALARIVRGRATSARYIEGMMRHGYRGAAELAETVDRLVDFAETTNAVASSLFDLVHDAYVVNPRVRDFLLRENPDAARALAERLEDARRKGLWHPRRNDLAADLATMRKEEVA
ncbi:MAG: cobaltochelatase subunit CobN [Methyloceanibacter sp.]|uniref:cobaltochelatase subunit CobN n=1 Tax=Methyloceanibacter sp. TaxID=1965321 RepID=UPI003D9B2C68